MGTSFMMLREVHISVDVIHCVLSNHLVHAGKECEHLISFQRESLSRGDQSQV